jgi:hypothetical protein
MTNKSSKQDAAEKTATQAPDPFSPEAVRISEKDRSELGVKVTLVELACRKPNKQEWIRTDPNRVIDASLLKLEDSGDFYLVTPEMRLHSELFEMVKPYRIQLAVTRAGSPFLWAAAIPSEDGGAGVSWHRSGLQCQKLAETEWIRVQSDRGASAYVPRTTKADLPDPKWPSMDLGGLLKLCFHATLIDSPDHPVVKMLGGLE